MQQQHALLRQAPRAYHSVELPRQQTSESPMNMKLLALAASCVAGGAVLAFTVASQVPATQNFASVQTRPAVTVGSTHGPAARLGSQGVLRTPLNVQAQTRVAAYPAETFMHTEQQSAAPQVRPARVSSVSFWKCAHLVADLVASSP